MPEQNNNTEGSWFQISLMYGDSIYKEITQVRAFNYQSLIGKTWSKLNLGIT